jgi:hypothetical protein
MPRLRAAFSLAGMLLCLTAAAFSGDPSQGIGFRQPDVTDWRAFHRENDEYWARIGTATTGWRDVPTNRSKIRLTAANVRDMRILAGISDDDPHDSILKLQGMKTDRYLLVTVKPNGCFQLFGFAEGWHFKPLWSIDKLPNGSDICRLPACPEPQVLVGQQHEISVMTFSRSTPTKPFCDQYSSASYVPKGGAFELKNQDAGTLRCSSSDAYWAGQDVAFRQAAGSGETLAIVENLPALSHDRYALVLQRRTDSIQLLRMDWQQDAWSQAVSRWRNTASSDECFSQAASFPVAVVVLSVPEKKAQDLAASLEQVDLRSDRCARRADMECAHMFDGRAFSVQVADHPPVLLTDVKGLRGYSSENPPLYEWVYKLLGEASHAKRITNP